MPPPLPVLPRPRPIVAPSLPQLRSAALRNSVFRRQRGRSELKERQPIVYSVHPSFEIHT